MRTGTTRTRGLAAGALALQAMLLLGTGCHVDVNAHKDGDHDDNNVKIATPFGGLSVRTNEAAVEGGVGLSVYPGAEPLKKDKGDNGSADVNMSFGSFHLGVKALSYHTTDSPDKVTAFYRKDMARYGAVILCRNDRPVGSPDHTQDGLTCDKDGKGHMQVNADESKDELKAGSRLHQHIVALDPDGSGTKIGLVALDLPGNFGKGDGEDKQ